MIEWRDIPGYGNLYQVSNTGAIKSLERRIIFKNGRGKLHKERILSPGKDRYGYYQVVLCRNTYDQRTIKVHRLVAISFIENPENLPQVNHLDGNKENNNSNNLEWSSGSGNHRHATEKGLKAKGDKHGKSKLTDNEVRTIKRAFKRKGKKFTQAELARKFGVSPSQINSILKEKNWKHIKV